MMAVPNTIDGLIDRVFGDVEANFDEPGYMNGRAILSPKNVDVDAVNAKVLAMVPGEVIPFFTLQCFLCLCSCPPTLIRKSLQ